MATNTSKSYTFAVGRRKTAVARVRIHQKGEGEIKVNEQAMEEYFPTFTQQFNVKGPLNVAATKVGDITVKVQGGGKDGQSEAVRHGIARALVEINPEFRTLLKKAGYLRRDPRKKERKKPGLRRARRARQWSKR